MQNGGLILWNAVAVCEMSTTSWQVGRHSEAPIVPFGAMVEYRPISAKDQSRLHQFGQKVLPGIFLGYGVDRGENLERRYWWLQTLRSWKFWTRQSAKEITSKKKTVFYLISPVADGTAKLSGRDFEVRESLYGRSNLFGVKISEPTDETKDDAEARNDFWLMEDFIDRHHVEPPFQLNVLKEDTEIH